MKRVGTSVVRSAVIVAGMVLLAGGFATAQSADERPADLRSAATRSADTRPSASRADATRAAIVSGRQLYMKVGCWQCHGTVGQGGAAGPRLAPGPMPIEALRAFLRNDVRAMPAYPASILSVAAIADIHAYLQSIPAAPSSASLPLLRDLQ